MPHLYEQQVQALAKQHLVGRKIVEVRHMTEAEAAENGWESRPVIIVFDDGNWICPMSDDEGNDAGALALSFPGFETIAVI